MEVINKQLALMVHAVGGRTWNMYRNSFTTTIGSDDDTHWQELCDRGFAVQTSLRKDKNIYQVSPVGIDFLSKKGI